MGNSRRWGGCVPDSVAYFGSGLKGKSGCFLVGLVAILLFHVGLLEDTEKYEKRKNHLVLLSQIIIYKSLCHTNS